jgi:MoaA/NifB/PqqE/SkfB family radical SAM enzyme/SAM-dependent methyltransferase
MKGTEFFGKVGTKPPFSKMHPAVAAFFKGYLSNEKVIPFNDFSVLNTHFPPYPSRAFENLVEQFSMIGEVAERRLYSVTLAVTNRCMYDCWHCYNAGRSQIDIPLPVLKKVIGELQEMSAVRVTLSGGEPLLRNDLEEIAGCFGDSTYLNLNTTGYGLTSERARALCDNGVFAVGVSIDSADPDSHDRMRGRKGAFDIAIQALALASQNGLYPYIVTVATHELLQPENFKLFMRFAAESGALEVHLLEPCATGKLAGKQEVLLCKEDRELILNYQKEIARDDNLPILSSFLYLESPEAFGCGAGITHLYIDGSGEVSPCNLVPISFGNIKDEPFRDILNKMGRHFCKPRTNCVGHTLAGHIKVENLPTTSEVSNEICEKYLPREHDIPRFFKIKSSAQGEVGSKELQSAYDSVHEYYDKFWVIEAGKPVEELIKKIPFTGKESVFEAGCGTGFATVLIADRLHNPERMTAVDLSGGMLAEARNRALSAGLDTIRFIKGDALEMMRVAGPYDIVFTSWVLGYIPLKPFFTAARSALADNGCLAFIVHKENSPREPLQIFGELVVNDPSILEKRVEFDFPHDMKHIESEVTSIGFEIEHLREDNIIFHYDTPEKVLEHLLKSGAGTAFYEAVDPARRKEQENQFVKILKERRGPGNDYEVVHDYVSCIARKS